MEIERRFLVRRTPEALEGCPHERMEQAYISTDPLIRVRRAGDRFVLTCKGRGLLSREEFELDISRESYERLLKKADGILIVKERYRVPLGAYAAELDVFAPPLSPLVVVEVEFPTEDAANAFAPPDWFGREVTYDPAYTNAALSQGRIPALTYDPQDLKSVLLYVRDVSGPETFDDAQRMFSILPDLSPELQRDGNVLRQMIEAGLLRKLSAASGGDGSEVLAEIRDWLTDYLMLSGERVNCYMDALQAVYGLTPKSAVTLASGTAGDCTWTLSGGGVLTVSGAGAMADYLVDSPLPWKEYLSTIRTIHIHPGVTTVGQAAFRGCENLKSVSIAKSVTVIKADAFRDCANLTSVNLPNSVTEIKAGAFRGCRSLTGVRVPQNAKTDGAFDPITALQVSQSAATPSFGNCT